MKTPKELRAMVKKIDKSNRTQHTRIKDVLLEIVEVMDYHYRNEPEPEHKGEEKQSDKTENQSSRLDELTSTKDFEDASKGTK